MSEVEKLYENAGIEKRMACYFECFSETCSVDCEHFEKLDMGYPPFTAEKQIELIKWLVKHYFNFMVYELTEKDFTFEVINKRLKQTSQFVSLSENNFEEGLAKVLNCFWQDLTEEEKQQVKGILK